MHHIPDDVFLIAARELAASVRDEDLEQGSLYPPLGAIREVSLRIAAGITKYAYCKGELRVRRTRTGHTQTSTYFLSVYFFFNYFRDNCIAIKI